MLLLHLFVSLYNTTTYIKVDFKVKTMIKKKKMRMCLNHEQITENQVSRSLTKIYLRVVLTKIYLLSSWSRWYQLSIGVAIVSSTKKYRR